MPWDNWRPAAGSFGSGSSIVAVKVVRLWGAAIGVRYSSFALPVTRFTLKSATLPF